MKMSARNMVALAICIVSAAVCIVWLQRFTVIAAGVLWVFTGDWLGRRLPLIRYTFKEINVAAGQGVLKLNGTARTIWIGGLLLIAAGFCIK